jgi:hypothetical protein
MTNKRRRSYKLVAQKLTGIKRSPETSAKHSQTKKRLFAQGKLVPWNKGLTAMMDPRIALGIQKEIETKRNKVLAM